MYLVHSGRFPTVQIVYEDGCIHLQLVLNIRIGKVYHLDSMKQNGISIYLHTKEMVIIIVCIYPNLIITIMVVIPSVLHGDTCFLICPRMIILLPIFLYTRVIRQLQRAGVQLYITTDK